MSVQICTKEKSCEHVNTINDVCNGDIFCVGGQYHSDRKDNQVFQRGIIMKNNIFTFYIFSFNFHTKTLSSVHKVDVF